MKITAIKTFMTKVGNRPRSLCKVETDEGICGWGECYNVGPDLAIEPTLDYIFELVKGIDPRRIEFIMMKLFQQFRFPPGALGLSAMSGLDHALWDISGKAAGLPVYMLLGGNVRDRVQVYRSIGGRDAAEAADVARKLHEDYGFTVFKTGPFQVPPDEHRWGIVCKKAAEYFKELRKRCPDEWEFAFDPHAKIFEPVRALQLANALAPYDPYFYEEPLRPENSDAWSRLRAQLQVPLATGESLHTIRVPRPDVQERRRHHTTRRLHLRRPAGDAQNCSDRRGTLRIDRPTQPDGTVGDGGKPPLLRRDDQLQRVGVSPAE